MKVFTNGCFDILHYQHIKLFLYCALIAGKHGKVIVGMNSDCSIKKLKGDLRPIIPQQERLSMLRAIKYIDFIHVFCEETPYELIKRVRPDVLVKGHDWQYKEVVGSDLVKEVKFAPTNNSMTTTKLIEKCYHVYKGG